MAKKLADNSGRPLRDSQGRRKLDTTIWQITPHCCFAWMKPSKKTNWI